MKSTKNFLGIIIILIIIGLLFTACPTHTHTYSATWSYNATQHYKQCSCGEKIDVENHVGSSCNVCGYDNTPIFPMQMISISTGTFTMGSESGGYSDEQPVRQVTLTAFKMGKYEVTQEQYQEVMGTNPSSFRSNPAAGETQGKRPVEAVTWFDAIEFCNRLSTKEGLTPVYTITGRTPATGYPITAATVTANWENNGYRLPTEAQWEYACRATGTTTDWSFGNAEAELVNYAWYNANSNDMTHQVGRKTTNAWGLYDMHGNVWEWCWDWYGSSYYGESDNTNNPMGTASGTSHVRRGGCWLDSAGYTRSAYRYSDVPGYGDYGIGFRVVRP
ncbi:MAG: formylglycine-generating enzyme family protein [Treponema sp.]|nr:formylglycine-generating enzyme family protein [Treponema sp.]